MNTPETNTPPAPAVPKVVVNAAIAGTVLIGIGAAVLSFTALADLAVRAGTPRGLSYVWPIIVDGVIVVATIAIVALRSADSRARAYAWLLLGGGAVISIIANGAHAVVAASASTPQWMAITVASVPPVVLLSITHLTVILARRARASQPASHAVAAPTDPDDQPSAMTDDWEDLLETATATSHHATSQPASHHPPTVKTQRNGPASHQPVSHVRDRQPLSSRHAHARQPVTLVTASHQPATMALTHCQPVSHPVTATRSAVTHPPASHVRDLQPVTVRWEHDAPPPHAADHQTRASQCGP